MQSHAKGFARIESDWIFTQLSNISCTKQTNLLSWLLYFLRTENCLFFLSSLVYILSADFYWQTRETVNTWKISGMLIVYWPIKIKFRIREQTSTPQTNYRCCLRLQLVKSLPCLKKVPLSGGAFPYRPLIIRSTPPDFLSQSTFRVFNTMCRLSPLGLLKIALMSFTSRHRCLLGIQEMIWSW